MAGQYWSSWGFHLTEITHLSYIKLYMGFSQKAWEVAEKFGFFEFKAKDKVNFLFTENHKLFITRGL